MGSVRKILVQIFSRGRTSKECGQGPEMNTAAENPTSFKSCAAKEANSTHGRNHLFFLFFLSFFLIIIIILETRIFKKKKKKIISFSLF
jgi:hypothetical protein